MKKYLLSLFAMLAVVFSASAADITDVLDNAWTGISGTNYSNKTDLSATSDAVYAINCAGGNDAIQLRSNNNSSGIVTTTSGGTATKIEVTWNTNTTAGRVLQVYGAIKAYSAPTDLYDSAKQGALLGELAFNDRDDNDVTTLDLTKLNGEYTYIGIRSKSGALYLDEVDITWSTGATVAKPTISPASTSFIDEMTVTVTPATGTTVYVTTDGTDPSVNNFDLVADTEELEFTIGATTTVKAVSFDGINYSSVVSATYTMTEKSDIIEVNTWAVGTFLVEGTVTAAGDAGFIVDDGTDYIYVYYGSGNTITAGKVVRVLGTTTEYKGVKQFTSAAEVTDLGEETLVYPDPGVLEGTDFDFAQENAEIEHGYYSFVGTLSVSGNYVNIAVEGAETAVGSVIKPFEDLTDLSGKEVVIEGYGLYVNGKYVYFIATKIEEYVEKFTVTMADGVAGGTLEFEPETAAAGETVTINVIPDEGMVLESITANCVNINQAVELTPGTTENVYTLEMPADDVIVLPIFTQAAEEIAIEQLNVERYPGLGYTADEAMVDFTLAKEFLGIDDISTATLVIINPDGTEIENYSTYDGWFNTRGYAETWNDLTYEANDADKAGICVKFWQAIPNGTYPICDMNGADVPEAEYTVTWALKANNKTYVYNIVVKFLTPPEYPEVTTVGNTYTTPAIEYDYADGSYSPKYAEFSEEELAAICTELGVNSIDDAFVYGYNPTTQTFIPKDDTNAYDGWRDANGDFAMWTGDSTVPMCVKYADGKVYVCYNLKGCPNAELAAYWALGNSDGYAVLVQIPFIYSGAPVVKYNVTWGDYEGGTVSAEPTEAEEGETVTVSYTENQGFVLEQLIINWGPDGEEQEVELTFADGQATFEMPAYDVEINPVFVEAPYYGFVATLEGEGSIAFDPASAQPGTTVQVSVQAEEGWVLDNISAFGETTNQVVELTPGATEGIYNLTMIADNVLIAATFIEEGSQDFSGLYYVRNVATGKYWGAGNNWGTQASLVDEQQYVTFEMTPNGSYTMETMVSNGGTSYFFGGEYMDGGAVELTINKVAGTNYVTIGRDNILYGYNGQNTVLGRDLTDATSENAHWQLLTQEEIDAENAAVLATATQENPVDATFLIKDPFFSRNRREANVVWNNEGNNASLAGGGNGDNNAESYMKTFSISQTLANAPAGVYKLTAFAAVTYHDNRNIKEYDGEGAPQVFINEEAADFFEMETADRLSNQATMRSAFDSGKYAIDPLFVEVGDDGTLTVGAKSDRADIWAVWDDFGLTYYGPDADLATVKLGDLVAELNALRAEAEEYAANPDVPAAVVEELNTALSDTENVDPTEEAYKAAIEEVKTAVDKAKAMINAKDVLDKMLELTERNNFASESAIETYYGQWKAKYDDGTLTTEEAEALVNPFIQKGWNHTNGVDFNNYLLSAWTDANGEACYDFAKSLYINNWSTEGESDGTDFKVPFYEYWTGDDNSLGATTWTATLNDIAPGAYEVSAWVRVRAKNGTAAADATGITMQVNDGEAVDVTEGQTDITNQPQFNIAEYTAVGTVGEDGVLTLKFEISGDNTISWLAFQNVQYKPVTYSIGIPDLAGATIATEPEGEAVPGEIVTIFIDPEEGYAVDLVQVVDATGAPVAEVSVGETENTYTFEMPATDVLIDVTLGYNDPNDYTYLIENPAYLHEGEDGTADYAGWTWSPAPGESGWKYRDYDEPMNLVTYSGNVNFSFEQTIPEVPAGQYRLSVYGFYRAGSAQDEAARVASGESTHNLAMFAEYGDAVETQNILNLYEGAADVDVTGKNNHSIVPGYEDFFVPDGAVDSREFYIAGYYRNDLIINVTEDGPVRIGVTHPEGRTYDSDYAPIGMWELYRLGDPEFPTQVEEIIAERETGQNYGTSNGTVDFTAAKEFLGIEDISEASLWIINPDGTEIENYATYDGWFNTRGYAETWSDLNSEAEDADKAGINVKFWQAIPNGTFTICDMNGADVVGAEYTVTWALKANDKTYQYNITVKFVKPAEYPEVTTVGNLYLASTVEYDYAEGSYVEKTSTLDEEAIGAICDELGVTSLNDLYVYGYNPTTQTFLPFPDTRTYDGWRKPDGDFANWTGSDAVPFCVKFTDGVSYSCFNLSHMADATYAAYWAFGNVDGYVVLVEIPFIYSGAPLPPELTYDDLNIIDEQGIEFNYDLGTSYQGDVATVDVDAIKAAFGTTAEPTLNIYAVLSDNSLDPDYTLGATDGWRNVNGDWESWGGESVFCVKADFTAESDQIYYVGTKWGASQEEEEPGTYVARYVFVNEDGSEKPDAVLFTVTINYGNADSIEGIFADQNGEQKIFDLSGRRISTITKGGMYIINGKKVFVK